MVFQFCASIGSAASFDQVVGCLRLGPEAVRKHPQASFFFVRELPRKCGRPSDWRAVRR